MSRIDDACTGEMALLDPAVRADRSVVEQLLHPDFAERGRSGRLWSREEMISALIDEVDVGEPVEVHELQGDEVTEGVVLVTYVSIRSGVASGRSSLWIEHDGRMRVRWHQGTPLNGYVPLGNSFTDGDAPD